jgi:hypothetical protein
MTEQEPTITVRKIDYRIPVSCCALPDVECNHPDAPPLTRRQWFRWWIRETWYRRPRVHLGPCNHEDCW